MTFFQRNHAFWKFKLHVRGIVTKQKLFIYVRHTSLISKVFRVLFSLENGGRSKITKNHVFWYFVTYLFLVLDSALAADIGSVEASYMNNFHEKSFPWRSTVFEISVFEVPFLTVLEVWNIGIRLMFEAQASHRKVTQPWNFHRLFYYILGMFAAKKVFGVLLCITR